MAFCYSVYGVSVSSEIPFPELVLKRGSRISSQVDIRLSPVIVPSAAQKFRVQDHWAWETASHSFFLWPKELRARVSSSKIELEILDPELDSRVLRLVVLGPLFEAVLRRRGYLVLHAGAVSRKKQALAFAGRSGSGKSTLTALLLKKKYLLVSENLLAVDARTAAVHGGPLQLKLDRAALKFLSWPQKGLSRIEPASPKFAVRIAAHQSEKNARLKTIFIFSEKKDKPQLLQGPEALMAVLPHTYGDAFFKTKSARETHFRQLTRLLSKITVCRLPHRPSWAIVSQALKKNR